MTRPITVVESELGLEWANSFRGCISRTIPTFAREKMIHLKTINAEMYNTC